jgi:leucyl aminopeptidase
MADLHQFRTAPEEPLDCIYILQSTESDPLSGLEFSAKERKSLRAKAKALGPRGEEGEIISGECPLDIAHRITFVGVGNEKEITHSKLRETLTRVMRQATKNREYQIALGVPVKVHGLTSAESRIFALREASISDYTFDFFKSKKNEFEKIDGLHILPLVKESEEELEERLQRVRLLRTSQVLARDLGNRPANDLNPETFVQAAKDMAEEAKGAASSP